MFNTGFSWLRDDVDMINHSIAEPFTDKVVYISQERLDADSLAKKIAVINTEDVEGLFVAPLIGAYQAGLGSDDAELDVYGCVTQGTPMQSSSQNPAMLTLLGTVKTARVNLNNATLLDENQADVGGTRSNMIFTHPVTGTEYQSFGRGGEGTNELNAYWMATTTLDGIDPPDLSSLAALDKRGTAVGGGIDQTPFCYIPGLSMFQKLVVTCNMGSLSVTANALIAKVY